MLPNQLLNCGLAQGDSRWRVCALASALGNQNTLRQPLRNLPTESWVYLNANGRLP